MLSSPVQDGLRVFTRGDLFASPSRAASILIGRQANGWLEWKDGKGRSLDEVKRQSVKSVD